MSLKESLSLKIDTIFDKWNTNETPGCSLGVIKNGEFIYKKNYGLKNLENKEPITSNTIFDIASVSKQFTAACIALLHLKGKLSLNTSLKEILPEVKFDNRIKIRHLIHHESGIKDYQYSLTMLNYSWDEIQELSKDNLFKLMNDLPELDFVPGNQHNYSNTNYFLLGLVVEQITGKSLVEFAEEEIFTPLGMKDTSFEENYLKINENKATGYSPKDDGYRVNNPKSRILGPRGVYSSVDDLYLWDQNFYSKKVGGKELIELLEKPSREKITGLSLNRWNDPTQHQGYAFGLLTDFYRGEKIIRHGGDFAGFTSEMLRFPEKELTIIILTNCGNINPTTLAFKTADVILGNEFQSKSPYVWKQIKQAEEKEIEALVGIYYDFEYNSYFEIFREENKLILANDWMKTELDAVSTDIFLAVNQPNLLLIEKKDGKMIIETEFYRAEIAKFVPIKLDKQQLEEYCGKYFNEKFKQKLQITIDEDKLKIKLKSGEQILSPISLDIFRNGFLQLGFHRRNNEISFARMNTNGAKGIIFRK
ncbi:MAG: class A beta-lactamase-related serine hydrolase [Candidatus Heimdallarchaeota archaeon]|nr:class A beta-lactamase-related serine hydrolase [Candidatus Heimdallarchaeota archaeon]